MERKNKNPQQVLTAHALILILVIQILYEKLKDRHEGIWLYGEKCGAQGSCLGFPVLKTSPLAASALSFERYSDCVPIFMNATLQEIQHNASEDSSL